MPNNLDALTDSLGFKVITYLLVLDFMVLSALLLLIVGFRLWRLTGKKRRQAKADTAASFLKRHLAQEKPVHGLTHSLRQLSFTEQSLLFESFIQVLGGHEHHRLREIFIEAGVAKRLHRAVDSDFWQNRLAAVRLLALAEPPQREAWLLQLFRDPHPLVRIIALNHTFACPTPAVARDLVGRLALAPAAQWMAIQEALVRVGPPSVIPLKGCITHNPTQQARRLAVGVAQKLPDPSLMTPLCQLVLQGGEVGATAAVALGSFAHPHVLATLTGTLSHEEPEVRVASAWALGELAAEDALNALALGLPDHSFEVRLHCAVALRRLGPAGEAALQAMAEHEDKFVRQMVHLVMSLSPRAVNRVRP